MILATVTVMQIFGVVLIFGPILFIVYAALSRDVGFGLVGLGLFLLGLLILSLLGKFM